MGFFSDFLLRPDKIGGLGAALIPIFALVYASLPSGSFSQQDGSLLIWLYFSVVTVTTLGFGDIYPVTELARALVLLEVGLGVLLAGFFLNAYSLKLAQGQARVERLALQQEAQRNWYLQCRRTLLDQDVLLSFYIQVYLGRLYALCTPIEKRRAYSEALLFSDDGELTFDVVFLEMRDLFKPSPFNQERYGASTVEAFFRRHHKLVQLVTQALQEAPLREWPALQKLCLDFIYSTESYDYSYHILRAPEITHGSKRQSDYVAAMIAGYRQSPRFEEQAHVLNPYIALYFLAQRGLAFCAGYRAELSQLRVEEQAED